MDVDDVTQALQAPGDGVDHHNGGMRIVSQIMAVKNAHDGAGFREVGLRIGVLVDCRDHSRLVKSLSTKYPIIHPAPHTLHPTRIASPRWDQQNHHEADAPLSQWRRRR